MGAGDIVLIDNLVKKQKNIKKVVVWENDVKIFEILEKFFDFNEKFAEEIKNGKIVIEQTKGFKEFFEKEKRKFDAVFVDLCDVNKNGCFDHEFYKNVKAVCNEGVVVSQKLQDISLVKEYQKKMFENGYGGIQEEFCEVPDHNTRFAILKAKI